MDSYLPEEYERVNEHDRNLNSALRGAIRYSIAFQIYQVLITILLFFLNTPCKVIIELLSQKGIYVVSSTVYEVKSGNVHMFVQKYNFYGGFITSMENTAQESKSALK